MKIKMAAGLCFLILAVLLKHHKCVGELSEEPTPPLPPISLLKEPTPPLPPAYLSEEPTPPLPPISLPEEPTPPLPPISLPGEPSPPNTTSTKTINSQQEAAEGKVSSASSNRLLSSVFTIAVLFSLNALF